MRTQLAPCEHNKAPHWIPSITFVHQQHEDNQHEDKQHEDIVHQQHEDSMYGQDE